MDSGAGWVEVSVECKRARRTAGGLGSLVGVALLGFICGAVRIGLAQCGMEGGGSGGGAWWW